MNTSRDEVVRRWTKFMVNEESEKKSNNIIHADFRNRTTITEKDGMIEVKPVRKHERKPKKKILTSVGGPKTY